jgi:oligosaccharide repeat unit polymerase
LAETIIIDSVGYLGALILTHMCTVRARCASTFAHLFSIVWGTCLFAAQFFTTSTTHLPSGTLLTLFGAWWCLLLGALCVLKHQPKRPSSFELISTHRAILAVFVLLALQASVVIWELPSLESVLSIKQLAMMLRVAGIAMASKCPWWLEVFRNAYFVYIPLAVLLRKRKVLSRWALVAVIAASALLSFSRMTRTPLLGASVALWASWVLLYRRPAGRAWAALGAVGGVMGLVFLLSQTVIDSGEGRIVQKVQLLEPYFGGSMHAFETILDGAFPRSPGLYSADMVYYALNKLDFVSADSFPSIIRPYSDNGTNVYTFLDSFALDGGIAGALVGAFAVGLLGGIVFNKASASRSIVFVTVYSSYCYYIAMSILNNEFIRINVAVTVILVSVVVFIVRRRSPRRYPVRAFVDQPIPTGALPLEMASRR